jgi:tetratricopeptide (TPR) repeat protein
MTIPGAIGVWWRVSAVLALGTLGAPAAASVQSQILTASGQAELQAGQSERALSYFDRAVAADQTDPFARYYRGVTRGRLGDADGAVDDLTRFVTAQPDDLQGSLELGIALAQAGRYRESVAWLARAGHDPGKKPAADFFTGWAELRDGDLDAAQSAFARAASDPALAQPATFYLGVVAYRRRQWQTARGQFETVTAGDPQTPLAREAGRYLRLIPGAGKPYEVYGSVGLEYDGNVILAPSSVAGRRVLGITEQSDGRASILAGATYAPWRAEYAELRIGYELFQSLYFNLTQFDLQNHRPWIQLSAWGDRFEVGVQSRYDYYLLDTSSFLQQVSAVPWVRVFEGDFGHSEIYYRLRWRDYLDDAYASLDALDNAVGVRQVAYLRSPDRYIWLGYQYDNNAADNHQGDRFAYDGQQFEVGIGWAFPTIDASAEAGYRCRYEDYASASDGRRDQENGPSVVIGKRLTDWLAVSAAYFGTFNESNQTLFHYNRQTGSVQLEAQF